jgi:hypothetical protein
MSATGGSTCLGYLGLWNTKRTDPNLCLVTQGSQGNYSGCNHRFIRNFATLNTPLECYILHIYEQWLLLNIKFECYEL